MFIFQGLRLIKYRRTFKFSFTYIDVKRRFIKNGRAKKQLYVFMIMNIFNIIVGEQNRSGGFELVD